MDLYKDNSIANNCQAKIAQGRKARLKRTIWGKN